MSEIIQQLATDAVNARYEAETRIKLQTYYANVRADKSTKTLLLEQFLYSITNPRSYPDYEIPRSLLDNNEFVRKVIQEHLYKLRQEINRENIEDLQLVEAIARYHEFIKFAQNRWFLTNSGVILEIMSLPNDLSEGYKNWLESFGVRPGDEVLYRHVISNNGRKKLRSIGFLVPFDHWDKIYTIGGIKTSADLLVSNPKNVGIWSEGSWIYDPNIHNLASDGKPYVAFDFYKEDLLVGYRYCLGDATPTNEFRKHYEFATRDERRRKLADSGEFVPQVFGVFYPREELIKNAGML